MRCLAHARVHDKRPGTVVLGELNPDPIVAEKHESALDGPPLSVHDLIDVRPAQVERPVARLDPNVAIPCDRNAPTRSNLESDGSRVRARSDNEIEFELPLVAVEHQIDSRIDAIVFHPAVAGHPPMPGARVIADEVVALARKFIQMFDLGVRARTRESDANGLRLLGAVEARGRKVILSHLKATPLLLIHPLQRDDGLITRQVE